MKFGVELVPYHPIETCIQLAKEAERIGLNQLWVCEHYHNRHVYSILTLLALHTRNIKLGPGVTNPYLTHPVVIATAIATLSEISGGRALLGISAGDPLFLSTAGIEQKKPVATVREAILIIKALLRGETVNFEGEIFRCYNARLRFKPVGEIPVYVGGRREKMLKLAAEVAEGVLINASHPDDVSECLSYLQGSRIEKIVYLPTSIADSREKARAAARGVVSFVASSSPTHSLERHGIDLQKMERIRSLLARGELLKAREEVDERMIDSFSVCDEEELRNRIEELSRLGVDRIVFGTPLGPDPLLSLRRIGEILEGF